MRKQFTTEANTNDKVPRNTLYIWQNWCFVWKVEDM